MGCNSSYLRPDQREAAKHTAAVCLVWLLEQQEKEVPDNVRWASKDIYGRDGTGTDIDPVVLLCDEITSIGEDIFVEIIKSNITDETAVLCMNAWNQHKKADEVRKEQEKKDFDRKERKLIMKALSDIMDKMTNDELKEFIDVLELHEENKTFEVIKEF